MVTTTTVTSALGFNVSQLLMTTPTPLPMYMYDGNNYYCTQTMWKKKGMYGDTFLLYII